MMIDATLLLLFTAAHTTENDSLEKLINHFDNEQKEDIFRTMHDPNHRHPRHRGMDWMRIHIEQLLQLKSCNLLLFLFVLSMLRTMIFHILDHKNKKMKSHFFQLLMAECLEYSMRHHHIKNAIILTHSVQE